LSSKPSFRLTGTKDIGGFFRQLYPRPFSTLREVKRFINAFRLSIEMIPGEVNITDLICIELLRSYSIQAWRMIYERPEYFTVTDLFILNEEEWEQKRKDYYKDMYTRYPDDKRELAQWITERVYPLVCASRRKEFRLSLD